MCGIAGFSGSFEPTLLKTMNRIQAHRGPDDAGIWSDKEYGIGLAHRRLSIRDLTQAGHQPLFNDKKEVAIIYNGEIYNTEQVYDDLVSEGYKFYGNSDTEIILNLYLKYGTDVLGKLNGIFAFAIWDSRNSQLFIARDGMGVKPLYYSSTPKGFLFASELKALLQESSVSRDIDPAAIQSHLTYLWSPGPSTILKQVKKLEPGFALIIKEGKVVDKWSFYQPPLIQQIPSYPLKDAIVAVRNAVETAVERQMVADVPVGAFLSGGLDSSAITAFAKKYAGADGLKCFTISIDDKDAKLDGMTADLPYAKRVAKHLDVDLLTVHVGPEIADELTTMIYHLDEPQADTSPLNVLFISRMAKDHGIKVLLSGTGGDDIFSGYRRHKALNMEKYWSWLPMKIRTSMSKTAKMLPNRPASLRRINKALRYANLEGDERIASYFNWLEPDSVNNLLSSELQAKLPIYNPLIKTLAAVPETMPALNRMLLLEQKYFLADHNLNYTDKMSMAEGVEVRVPLLDPDLVKLAANLPISYKQRGKEGKWIFKKAMEGILPNDVIYRPKSGFGTPLRTWLNGPLKALVRDILSESSISKRNWFDPKAVTQLLDDNEMGKVDGSYSIFALLCIELWGRIFLDEESVNEKN
jgi:asparagine synthase (glutamine-hydrolysing)